MNKRSAFAARPLAALLLAAALLSFSPKGFAQGLEIGAAWSHVTGNFGLDGFDANLGYWFSPRAALIFNYGDVYDNSPINAFELSSLGALRVKTRMQNFLIGPRIAFPGAVRNNNRITPFAEALFGGSHLRSEFSQAIAGAVNSTDNAFTWALGGGADYDFGNGWGVRINLDLLRTHFADTGQSRLRLALGGMYKFGGE
ncbi:MAG: outer membrane beta-barrel protein [Acidobacteria bacterium]|nr:outer membrane beta-barrel protein [Acidobacteriota bacterium]